MFFLGGGGGVFDTFFTHDVFLSPDISLLDAFNSFEWGMTPRKKI